VGGLDEIRINVVLSEHGATDRCYADSLIQDIHFLQYFGYQTVRRPVRAAGTIM
jgi:hypothetical protein